MISRYYGIKRYASQFLNKVLKILYGKEIQHLNRQLLNFLILEVDYKEAEEMKGKGIWFFAQNPRIFYFEQRLCFGLAQTGNTFSEILFTLLYMKRQK